MSPEQQIFNQAAEWFAILQDDNISKAEYQSWRAWLAEDPAHARVWQRVEALSQPFQTLVGTVPANVARETLGQIHNSGRRRALRLLGIGGAVIATGGLLRGLPWQAWQYEYAVTHATYHTRIGERQQFRLEDGTMLTLNTASAVDIDYSQELRRIVLRQGEIHVESAHDIQAKPRPLVVDTQTARITALGTRFAVRSDMQSGHVAVFDGAVSVAPEKSTPMRVAAGQQARFTAFEVATDGAAELAREAWSAGKMVADNIALQDFIHELDRYTAISIQVSPAVAQLRLVGVYSIAHPATDIPVILAALENALPVCIQQTSSTSMLIISR